MPNVPDGFDMWRRSRQFFRCVYCHCILFFIVFVWVLCLCFGCCCFGVLFQIFDFSAVLTRSYCFVGHHTSSFPLFFSSCFMRHSVFPLNASPAKLLIAAFWLEICFPFSSSRFAFLRFSPGYLSARVAGRFSAVQGARHAGYSHCEC